MRRMREAGVIAVLVIAACSKSGEHVSTVHMCVHPPDAVPAFLDETEQLLRARLTSAGLVPCTPKRSRDYQLGAKPVAFFCGRIEAANVEASINRPGQRECALELDVRADLSGSEHELTGMEAPIQRFRDDVCLWLRQRSELVTRPSTSTDPGVSFTIGGNGAVLGETAGPMPCSSR